MQSNELPADNTEVILFTKHPMIKLRARFKDGEFIVHDHWAIKRVKPDDVAVWDYA